MAVDEATKKQDELELYQIDDAAIVPFFRDHLDDLKKFVDAHKDANLSLLELLKQFIRTYRLPFNMHRYMEVQRTFIQQTLRSQLENRQAAVSNWIQEHAGRHRDRMIQLQCLYLERIKDSLIPQVTELLNHRIETLKTRDSNHDNSQNAS
ncbi:MAG: hypothetical protein IK012_11300 [Fibrobacter sp.]|uniref:hypothetical protein n=1 Tax=Fibrobacter sp. TaxID=35828 RepID=UPI0025BEE32F|nr:hypothetical protein [Fibrobacter sp.]MBR4785817.1 hypothetical protein [Fibrobacter sp.]